MSDSELGPNLHRALRPPPQGFCFHQAGAWGLGVKLGRYRKEVGAVGGDGQALRSGAGCKGLQPTARGVVRFGLLYRAGMQL